MSAHSLKIEAQMYQNRENKWVYLFDEGKGKGKDILGGKGAGLADMTSAGFPVPPGMIITTEACNSYYDYDKQFPEGMWTQTRQLLQKIEEKTGKRFGDPENPLLVSVRSGARISMPGMMDTVLNLGLNDATVEGLARLTSNEKFAYDSYRRFISMFGEIVMGVPRENFHRVMERVLSQTASHKDTELTVEQLREIIAAFKRIIISDTHGHNFPEDPYEQLRMAISAVFDSWTGKRAIDYRRINRIPDNIGTAVNIQAMVFGNMGEMSGTGVAFTRNPSTGEKKLYGEFLLNAQGEDVVAGIRTPIPIEKMKESLPEAFKTFTECAARLEEYYSDMQDIEFTVENNVLYILQTRTGKRTGAASVRVAVEMVQEKLIEKNKALLRVSPEHIDQLLHRGIDPKAQVDELAKGLPASPGAAQGKVVFDPDTAEAMAKTGEQVILVRLETSPDDFHGMVAAEAILTARGGMTSHAAVVARGMGKPCVAGANGLDVDYSKQIFTVDGRSVKKGDWITLDGSTGRVLLGKVPTVEPTLDKNFEILMEWADEARVLKVRANADTPHDAKAARDFGAQGIGLCRTEHMFFGEERLAAVRRMILSENLAELQSTLAKMLPFQQEDFTGIFKEMSGLPVTIRLLDPPLHEFLPGHDELSDELAELKLSLQNEQTMEAMDKILDTIYEKRRLLRQVERMREQNPMLGLRGCRLGILYPDITRMQVRAIFEAACEVQGEGIEVFPEVMIPLVSTAGELALQKQIVQETAEKVMGEHGVTINYTIGTMIELPRAALTAGKIAEHADFFSFGTNDLTQTTLGLSRDDAGRFLTHYVNEKLFLDDPFQTIDQEGVGELIKTAVERGRAVKPLLKMGICGEHGGEARSIEFCHNIGLEYVSCSPFRVPVARLAAAHAALKNGKA